jgi:hypothetical protein
MFLRDPKLLKLGLKNGFAHDKEGVGNFVCEA